MHAEQALGMYACGIGDFDNAIAKLETTIGKARNIGDFRRVEEVQIFLATIKYFQGIPFDSFLFLRIGNWENCYVFFPTSP